jgi:T5orf172 domain
MSDSAWFVYLLALSDCSAFKVGFSCNPLQRIHAFNRRYYERFDLAQSLLLRLGTESDARAIELALKTELADCRTESPAWVPTAAGGHTEWFIAMHFGRAEERLRSFVDRIEQSGVLDAAGYFRSELARMSGSFEPWAWSQAQQVCDASASAYTRHMAQELADSLRDWLDAYRYFDLPLYTDDPAVLSFVTNTARLRA